MPEFVAKEHSQVKGLNDHADLMFTPVAKHVTTRCVTLATKHRQHLYQMDVDEEVVLWVEGLNQAPKVLICQILKYLKGIWFN